LLQIFVRLEEGILSADIFIFTLNIFGWLTVDNKPTFIQQLDDSTHFEKIFLVQV
jgi:hypothetical protein